MSSTHRRPVVLGVPGSTRSISGKPRQGSIIDIVRRAGSEAELRQALCNEGTDESVQPVKQLGIRHGDGFNLYKSERKKTKRDTTFRNTEAALATAQFGPKETGAEVLHVQLNRHFFLKPRPARLKELKGLLPRADGLVLATPVYFGDRSLLIGNLNELIRGDAELKAALPGKIMGGIGVTARRDGRQETSLIYQLMDMLGIGFLGVGNDWPRHRRQDPEVRANHT